MQYLTRSHRPSGSPRRTTTGPSPNAGKKAAQNGQKQANSRAILKGSGGRTPPTTKEGRHMDIAPIEGIPPEFMPVAEQVPAWAQTG